MKIIIKSFNQQTLSIFIQQKLNPLFKIFNFRSVNYGLLQKNKVTVNKAPHVFSKSKEQFEMTSFIKVLVVNDLTISKLDIFNFKEVVKRQLITGISIKIILE